MNRLKVSYNTTKFIRKAKMGKKIEKSAKEKTIVQDDSRHKTPEPYHCTGNFKNDFEELGKESGLYKPPPVVQRPKPLLSPTHGTSEINTTASTKRGKEDKKQLMQQQLKELDEDQESQEDKEIETSEDDEEELMELFGFKPRTFLVKRTLDHRRPCVQVEQDHPEKHDTVTEIFIRGWQVDSEIMKNLSLCIVVMTRLHTINFWRVGLTSDCVRDLAVALSHCEQIRTLNIEANEPLEEENYYELIRDRSHLTKLRLRHCNITAGGIKQMAYQLGNVKTSNSKLAVLDLSCNKLGNEGAILIANALRTNRSLLSLSLANNGIDDVGCAALAEVLSRFFLTNDEILERRQLLALRNESERAKSTTAVSRTSSAIKSTPPTSRRGEARPGSVRSQEKEKGKPLRDKSSKGKKDSGKDDKVSAAALKGKKPEENKNARKAATIADVGKGVSKGGKTPKGGRASKTISQLESSDLKPPSDPSEISHPLLENVEQMDGGRLLSPGNFMLIFLNLSRNEISEEGVKAMHKAMGIQRSHMDMMKVNGTGMMKIILKENTFSDNSELLQSFEDFMASKDPFYKGAPESQSKSPD